MINKDLSVVLATRNEEKNIEACLKSIAGLAQEIIVVDESSIDNTRQIARKLGAKVYKVKHEPIFHKTKQIALSKAKGRWVLQLDADERVTRELREERKNVINMNNEEIGARVNPYKYKEILFSKHDNLIGQRVKCDPDSHEINAFLIPRLNYFLGKPLIHAGVYPDPAIRLVKNGKAHFPSKSVHENMEVVGNIAWLFSDLEHHDSPTFHRYLERFNRYTDLHAEDLKKENVKLNYYYLLMYSFWVPFVNFIKLFIRHKGFLDGIRGFVWSLFSSLHFPIAYFKYWEKYYENSN